MTGTMSLSSILKIGDSRPHSKSTGIKQLHRPKILEYLYSVFEATLSFTQWLSATVSGKSEPTENYADEDFEIGLNELISSKDEPICEFSDEVPGWFDAEKFQRGRAFASRHILGLMYAEQLSVVLLMSLPMLRRPLVFSGKSDTNEKAFRRYLRTVQRVISWYSDDIWNKDSKAYRNLMLVRSMHHRIDFDMKTCAGTTEQRDNQIEQLKSETSSFFLDLLHADLRSYSPNAKERQWLEKLQTNKAPFISQLGMAFTQIGFVGLLILRPEKFGASRASKADLEAFVYVWYVIGHQLGIADRYNICAGGLSETRRRCNYIMRHIVFPALAVAGQDWEHMARCVVAGVHRMVRQNSFEATFSYALWALSVPTPHIDSVITWRQFPGIWLFKSVLCGFHNIPGVADIFSVLLTIRLDALQRRLDSADKMLSQK